MTNFSSTKKNWANTTGGYYAIKGTFVSYFELDIRPKTVSKMYLKLTVLGLWNELNA